MTGTSRRPWRRRACTLVVALLVGTLVALAPTPSIATSHLTATRAQQVTGAVTGTRVFRLTGPSDHVAVYWRGNPHAHVSLAFSADGEHFAAPTAAGRDELGEQRRNGTTYGAVLDAGGTVAVRVNSDRPITRLTVLGMSDRSTASRLTVTADAASAATDQPAVVSRAQWAADPQYMTWAPQFYPTKKLIVHHTATSSDYVDQAAAESQIRSIYYYHSVTQNWGDIGYNFLIDKFGNVYEGRYSRDYGGAYPSGDDANGNGVTGAHVQGWNSGTVGIAMLGTYTDKDVTPAARNALEQLLAWEASRHGIDPQATEQFVNPVSGATITTPNIAGHRDYAATECPGGTFYGTLPTIRSDVAARIAGTPPDTTAPTAPSGVTATAGRTSVTLSWSASSDDVAVAGYYVSRSKSATGTFTRVATVSGTSYIDDALARRTRYYYKVRAYDAAGNLSPLSAVVSARTT